MRRRDPELSEGWGQIATPFQILTEGGLQKINCANTEGMLRIIQSIPSPKVEPFKRWLAKTEESGRLILSSSVSPQRVLASNALHCSPFLFCFI